MSDTKGPDGSGGDLPDVYTISSLDQVKVVADPLRVRILETIVLEPRTTKQIAEILGEKPTRLYHHVDALAEAGLIRLVDTRPVRGTTAMESAPPGTWTVAISRPKRLRKYPAPDSERPRT